MATSDNCHFKYFHFPDEYPFHVFEASKGTVPRPNIENINISDMIENKDFHVLKTNLLAVTNFNLEDEYDLRVLDDNLVKLFRLAQLGIIYLTQRESYLTKCIVMLQEEVKALKRDRKPFRQRGAQNVGQTKTNNHHQCKECGKVFITDMYLRCHEKRRHAIPPKGENPSPSITETPMSAPNQSTNSDASPRHHSDSEETFSKRQSQLKIENLEKELHDLKHRLAITERSINRKENVHSSPPSSPEIILPPAKPVLTCVSPSSHTPSANVEPIVNNPLGDVNTVEDTTRHVNVVDVKPTEFDLDKRFSLKVGANTKSFALKEEQQEKDSASIPWSPQPFPRKTKKRNELNNQGNSTGIPNHNVNADSSHSSSNSPLEEHLLPVKTNFHTTANGEGGDREVLKSQQKTILVEPTSGSLIKKLIRGSSPTITQLKNTFKRSLTNLYESVALNSRESQKEGHETQQFGSSHSDTSEIFRFSGESIRHRVKTFGKNQRKSVGKVAMEDNKGHRGSSLKGFSRSYFSFSDKNPVSKDSKEQERIENGENKNEREEEIKGNISTSKASLMYDIQVESDCDSLPEDDPKEDATEERKTHNLTGPPPTVHRQPSKEFDFSVFQVTKIKEELNESLNEPQKHRHETIEVVPNFNQLRLDHRREDDDEDTPG